MMKFTAWISETTFCRKAPGKLNYVVIAAGKVTTQGTAPRTGETSFVRGANVTVI